MAKRKRTNNDLQTLHKKLRLSNKNPTIFLIEAVLGERVFMYHRVMGFRTIIDFPI
jgi:hypothetical protein